MKLRKSDIKKYVDHRSYERGQKYFQARKIHRGKISQKSIKAVCEGSYRNNYDVETIVEGNKIIFSNCSCPIGQSGRCKHVVALLLTWINRPEEFVERINIESSLKKLSKDHLINIIETIANVDSKNEAFVEAILSSHVNNTKVSIIYYYTNRVSDILYKFQDLRLGSSKSIASDLDSIVSFGNELIENNDVSSAIQIFDTIIKQIIDIYEDIYDEQGEIIEVINDCVDGLEIGLEKTEEKNLREYILEILFHTYYFDIDYGGIEIGYNVPDIIEHKTKKQEKLQVITWIEEKLSKIKNTDHRS